MVIEDAYTTDTTYFKKDDSFHYYIYSSSRVCKCLVKTMKRSSYNLVFILLAAAAICFGLGLVFQIYVAHGLHSPPVSPNNQRTNSISTRSEPPVGIDELEVTATETKGTPTNLVEESLALSLHRQIGHRSDPKTFRYRDVLTIPPIVKAWRQAKLDWHQLIPKHLSSWERFGDKQGLSLLVSKEVQLTNYLTRLEETGILTKYGMDFGPLSAYAGWYVMCISIKGGNKYVFLSLCLLSLCSNIMSDSCSIHDEAACKKNQLCVWDEKVDLCFDFGSPNTELTLQAQKDIMMATSTAKKCENPSNPSGPPGTCEIYVSQPAVVLNVDSESQAMFYHW
jgi:hypothetical protein